MEGKFYTYVLKLEEQVVYVGRTTKPKKRLSQHRYDVRRKKNHPLYDFLREQGVEKLQLEVSGSFNSQEAALAHEQEMLKTLKPFGNLTRGGALDAFDSAQRALQWRKEHPVEAYKIALRASRIARNKKTTRAKKEPAANKLQLKLRRRAAVKKVWVERTDEQRLEVTTRISKGLKAFNKRLSHEEKRARNQHLAEARKNINIEARNQKIREAWARRKANANL